MEPYERNPDADFVLFGRKTPIKRKEGDYMSNSQKTISSKHLSASLNLPKTNEHATMNGINSTSVPDIADLERSINELKLDIQDLNKSLAENYGKSDIFMDSDEHYVKNGDHRRSSYTEDPELTHLLQRKDQEAVSHQAPGDSEWFRDPKHLTKPLGDYSVLQSMGASKRSVSPVGRSVGRFGAEIAAKDVDGGVTSLDVASNNHTFPVKLTAPHIVGVRSLLPPRYEVRFQDRERAKSPRARSRSVDIGLIRSRSASAGRRGRSRARSKSRMRDRSPSPLPVWMPTSSHANASSKPPPAVKKGRRGRSPARKRPATATGFREPNRTYKVPSKTLPVTRRSMPAELPRYQRPTVQPQPGHLELSFLRSADRIDTRRALVENSPYQQSLSRLRLERLRVEEEYLLQLKREAELERIRGPKPKWYAMKGPEFHYECNKNTTLHKSRDAWGDTIRYRNDLLEASREFTENMTGPVPALE